MRLKLKIKAQKRKGFTLLEVLYASIALAIVSTILFSISASAHLTTLNVIKKAIAQNIAQATLEDIKIQQDADLEDLISSTTAFFNYPLNGTGITPAETPDGSTYHVKTSGQILIDGITSFFPEETGESGVLNDGTIPKLETTPFAEVFTKTGPALQDYTTFFGYPEAQLEGNLDQYQVYKYQLTNSIYVEPMSKDGLNWSAGLVLFKYDNEHFYREITIKRLGTNPPSYSVKIVVTWNLNGSSQELSLTGIKN